MRKALVRFAVFGLVLLLLASCAQAGFQAETDRTDTIPDFEYTIPAGAGEQIDSGEPLDILPARIDAKVGHIIQIINHDDRGHLVGPWFVGANETLRQRFSYPGDYIGICSVHPSGEIKVNVTE